MKIHIAADHAGHTLKGELVAFLQELGHEVEDHGAFALNKADDYPPFVEAAAAAVARDPNARAIIIGGSGQGEAMCANRTRGIRAAVYYGGPIDIITLSRAHNDANVLSLGARFLTVQEAKASVQQWLLLPFSGEERHERRNKMLDIA